MVLDKEYIVAIACELARKSFYAYCRIRAPKLYNEENVYLKELCNTLQLFSENKILKPNGEPYTKICLNAPPRHAKSYTVQLFTQWSLGHHPELQIMVGSYNETLATKFARTVRDGIQEVKASNDKIVYSDIFDTKIATGNAAINMWAVQGYPVSFLSTSPSAMSTGIGCTLLIIDDIVRDHKEALNDRILQEHADWYYNTILPRFEFGVKQILIGTRWATKDLPGVLIKEDPDDWYVVKLRANKAWPELPKTDDDMLNPRILSCADYIKRKSGRVDPYIFSANYDQEPMDADPSLLMYPSLKTYRPGVEDAGAGEVLAMIDPAGKGTDYFTCVVYTVKDGFAYVKDILYDNSHGSVTEPLCANMLTFHKVSLAHIEENGLGEGAKRAIEKILRANGNVTTELRGYSQGANKLAKIIEHATAVCNTILFPEGWHLRWPKAYRDLTTCTRIGKMEHDDIQDTLSNIIIKSLSKPDFFFI